MLRKNAHVVSTRALSGKDVKTLRSNIAASFPLLSEAQLDDLVPGKAAVVLHKLANRVEAYGLADGGAPLFFEVHEQLLPTVYALWRAPHMLPQLHTYSEVSPKVLGGADLFLQGVIAGERGLPSFRAGDAMALAVPGHPLPFAVGTMETSTAEARSSGMKGRGLKVAHSFGDLLWSLGPKIVPYPSFKLERIMPYDASEDGSTGTVTTGIQQLKVNEHTSAKPAATAAAATKARTSASAQQAAFSDGDETETETETETESESESESETESETESEAESEEEAEEEEVVVDVNDPDALAVYCLLAALHGVQDSQLPMPTDKFYAQHILPAKPEGAVLDLKKSTFKKVPKLLSVHEKKKLLGQKLMHKVDHLVSVNRQHPLYTEFASSAAARVPQQAASAKAAPAAAQVQITVSTAYRVPSSLQPIFAASSLRDKAGSRDALFSRDEVATALQEYAAAQGTLKDSGNAVALDRLLIGALFNKKEPEVEGDELSLDHTLQRLLKKLQQWSRILCAAPQGEREVLKKGAAQPMLVQLEDRAGGRKHITRITGMETYAIEPEELATALQRRFQSSASVAKLPGKAADTGKEIALQGDCLQGAADFISTEFGLPKEYITQKSRSKG